MAFAIDVTDEDDPYFKLADKMGWIISNMGNNGITVLDIAPWGKYHLAAAFGENIGLIRLVTVVQHVPRWLGKFIPSVKYVHDYAPTIEEFHQRPFDAVMKSFVSLLDEVQTRVYLIHCRKREHCSRHL